MSGAPAPGDILAGRYRVDRVLGQGAMGVVVAATHVQLGQPVAVKFLIPDRQLTPERLERFLREGRATARLRSQHVTRVLDVGSLEDGAPFAVMELLVGRDLKALLDERGPLPVGEAVQYVLHACEGLAEAHAAGIVHRDVKPANLFLTTDASRAPCVKVCDFGISKLAGDLTLTREEQAMGSPLYMSPEQINDSKDVDARADVWSLGVTLYQLLAGVTPFEADKIEQVMWRIFSGKPAPLAERRPDLPPGLEAVILRCLDKERDARWPNLAAFASALAPWAPPSAAAYAERVARVQGVAPPLRTAVMPATSSVDITATTSPGAAPPAAAARSHAALTLDGSVSLAPPRGGPAAALAGAPPRRGRSALLLVTGALLTLAMPVGLWVSLRGLVARSDAPERAQALPEPPRVSSGAPSVSPPDVIVPDPPASVLPAATSAAPAASTPPLAAHPAASAPPAAAGARPSRVGEAARARPPLIAPPPATPPPSKPSIW